MNQGQQLAEKISLFLAGKVGNISGKWVGRMKKKDQLENFGYYFGKGLITVNGSNDSIIAEKRIGFDGCESEIYASIAANSITTNFDVIDRTKLN